MTTPDQRCKRCGSWSEGPTLTFSTIKYGVVLCDSCYLIVNKELSYVLCRSCAKKVGTTNPICEQSMRTYQTVYCDDCFVKGEPLPTRLRRPESPRDERALEAMRLFREVLLRNNGDLNGFPSSWWLDMLTEIRARRPQSEAETQLHTVVLAAAHAVGRITTDEYLELLPGANHANE